MAGIKGKSGGRRLGAGRKKTPSRQFRDAIQNIDDSEIIENLTTWARGKEVVCPHCLRNTGAYTADTVALQSALELLNRKRGKVPTQVQVDITETIQLNADQIDKLLYNNYGFRIEDVQRFLLTEGVTNVEDKI